MPLEKKVMTGMLAAIAGLSCTEKPVEVGGVKMYEATTDGEGTAYFTEEETGEEVEVRVVIENTDFPVSDATVIYFDGEQSEGFLISHPAFQPQLNIAAHNSNHQYPLSLTPAVLPHKGSGKEYSSIGAERYTSWAQANWEHTGCLNRDNMLTLMKPGAWLMKKLGLIETFGFSDEKFDEGAQYIEDTLPEGAVADLYVFIPYKHGLIGTTTITALDIRFSGGCSYENSSNSTGYESGSSGAGGSGGSNNGTDDCSGMLFCDEFSGSVLNGSKWNVVNDTGISVYGGYLSLPNASSVASPDFSSYCKDKRVDLRTSAYGSSVFLGSMGLSAGKDTGILSCDGEDAVADISGAKNGLSLYKSGGSLSLLVDGQVTSVPCAEDISYVQLTAGLNDKVEVDYVRMKCN